MAETSVNTGDKFVLTGLAEGYFVPGYRTVSGESFYFWNGDTVTAGDPAIAVGGLWVCEPRLSGSIFLPWEWLTEFTIDDAFPPCRCNVMIGPCRCGAFQREMARR
jgi:hypothetical protein